jgi:DNA repair protein RadC
MMTAASLQQQYQVTWSTLSSRQQAAFRGNVTWLLNKCSDPSERRQLEALRSAIQPDSSESSEKSSHRTQAMPSKAPHPYKLFTTYLKLHRKAVTLSDAPALGANVGRPAAAAAIASQLIGDQAQEHLLLLILDVRNTVVGVHTVHIGSTSQCIAHTGDILRVALLANASSIILAHNHPSGNPDPSDADVKVTIEVVAAAQLVNIDVLDHLVVTDDPSRFTSLRETRGQLFTRKYVWQ